MGFKCRSMPINRDIGDFYGCFRGGNTPLGDARGTLGAPLSYYIWYPIYEAELEESTYAADDLVYLHDAADGVFLFVEVACVYGDVSERLGCATLPQYLDGTDGVEHNGIDFDVLKVVDGALTESYYVTMVYARLHGVTCDITPNTGFFHSWYHDVTCGEDGLVIEYLREASVEVHIVIWGADGRVGCYNIF